jgi:hypothetical protein
MTRKGSQQLLVLGVFTLQVSRDFEPRQRKPEQSFSHVGISGIVRHLDAAISIASAFSEVQRVGLLSYARMFFI